MLRVFEQSGGRINIFFDPVPIEPSLWADTNYVVLLNEISRNKAAGCWEEAAERTEHTGSVALVQHTFTLSYRKTFSAN